MATQEMVLFVQVKNVINLGKFNDEWYISNGFSRLQLVNNKSSSRIIALAQTRQTKTSILSTIYKHYYYHSSRTTMGKPWQNNDTCIPNNNPSYEGYYNKFLSNEMV